MALHEEHNKMNKIIANIERMDIMRLKELDIIVTINGGLTIKELIKIINFHKFTAESLLYLINVINKQRCSFKGIGPFEERDGVWYNIRERQIDIIKKLTDENNRLKNENSELKKEYNGGEIERLKQEKREFLKKIELLEENVNTQIAEIEEPNAGIEFCDELHGY